MFDNNYTNFLEKAMDVSTLQRKVTADNLANYNTPGFKASTVDTNGYFQQLLDSQSNQGVTGTSDSSTQADSLFGEGDGPTVSKDETTQARPDGNNVDMDKEMMDMIKNNYMFSQAVQAINKEFSLNQIAIGK